MNRIFNLYIYIVLILYTLCVMPFVIPYLIILRVFFAKRFFLLRTRRFISWYGLIVIRVLAFPFIRVKFFDAAKEENIAPCIFVCNHRSSSDPYLLSFLPYEIAQVVNDWPFRIPALGLMAKLADYINIKQLSFEKLTEVVGKLLNQGVCIAVFPEGTRSGSNKMGQFHGALFRIALKEKCPIVPICVVGNEKIPTRNFVLHPGTIKVKKLPAIRYEEYKDMIPLKFKKYVRNIIEKEIALMEE